MCITMAPRRIEMICSEITGTCTESVLGGLLRIYADWMKYNPA